MRVMLPSPWLSVQMEQPPAVRKRGFGPTAIVALLAQHQADGVGDVALAAAVGPHNGRHTGFGRAGRLLQRLQFVKRKLVFCKALLVRAETLAKPFGRSRPIVDQ